MAKRVKQLISLGVVMALLLCGCGTSVTTNEAENSEKPEQSSGEEQAVHDEDYEEKMHYAATSCYGKYPEQITYTLGKLSGTNNSNMPDGDTYENNAYTRFLKDMLNVQNEDVFETMDDQYDGSVTMAVASKDIPDIMIVTDLEDLQMLVENDMIADLTESFQYCMSDTIKNIYQSYGEDIMDVVTFDGKIMAIPETNIADGPNLIWLRKDWMDELGLEEPKTLEDAENIVRQFRERDPGKNGEGNTIGIVCDPSLCGGCGYSSEYTLDIVFAAYGAFPKQWIYDDQGNVVYGSVQPEAKEALAHIRNMYEEGILDQDFLLRASTNIIELIKNGQCGSFFGPWWAPNNPLMDAIEENPDAEWEPYLLATQEDGTTSYHSQNPSYKYVVVRKGYEHPEVACKIISVLFDYIRYEESDNREFERYYQENVDPTARPLAINVDYNNALSLCYNAIRDSLEGKSDPESLNLLEYSYYEACNAYLENQENATPEQWAAYTSRITACRILSEAKTNRVHSLFFGETDTMVKNWWKLENLESQTYLQIVTGEKSLDAFDSFVDEWNAGGGAQITGEVSEKIKD